MRIVLTRFAYSPFAALGRLDIGDDPIWTLERPWEGNRPNVSCVPEGVYHCVRYSSAKYPDVWEVTGVPGRSKILIHAANWVNQLQGCIAPGLSLNKDHSISHSRKALQQFMHFTADVDEFDLEVVQFRPEYP